MTDSLQQRGGDLLDVDRMVLWSVEAVREDSVVLEDVRTAAGLVV